MDFVLGTSKDILTSQFLVKLRFLLLQYIYIVADNPVYEVYTVAGLKEDFFLCENFMVSKERCSKITKFEVDNNSNSFFCLLYFCQCNYRCLGIREDLGVYNRMIIIFVEKSVWHYLLQNKIRDLFFKNMLFLCVDPKIYTLLHKVQGHY